MKEFELLRRHAIYDLFRWGWSVIQLGRIFQMTPFDIEDIIRERMKK